MYDMVTNGETPRRIFHLQNERILIKYEINKKQQKLLEEFHFGSYRYVQSPTSHYVQN